MTRQVKIVSKIETDFKIMITLPINQAEALERITSCGSDIFLRIFRKHLGETYIRRHEDGLKDLFENIRSGALRAELDKIDKIKQGISDILTD